MSRPLYESAADLDRQGVVESVLCSAWGCSVERIPIKYGWDLAGIRAGAIKCYMEIKVRKAAYATYMLSLEKWMKGIQLTELTGLPCFLVVSLPVNDSRQIKYYQVKREPLLHRMGGRKDRGDAGDWEPVVEIPMSGFKTVRT